MTDLASILVGGAAGRPDSISGMQPALVQRLQTLMDTAPPDIRAALHINSGYRSPQIQAALYQAALGKYGSPEAARRWVAPPGHSQHGEGNAADLQFGSDAARDWVHQNAAGFGLNFPLSNENWHIELAGARGGHPPNIQMASAPAQAAPQPIAALFTTDAQAPTQAVVPPAVAAGLASPPPAAPMMLAANTSPLAGLADLFAGQQQDTSAAQQAEMDARAARRRALIEGAPDPFTRAVMA